MTMRANAPPALLLLLSLLSHSSPLLAPCCAYLNQIALKPPPPFFRRSCRSSTTRLHSLQPLVEEIASMIAANKKNNSSGDNASGSVNTTPVIFVGGKGGVGKTSISSALAVQLASSASSVDDATAADWNVLIISTDPAHSLGDALDVDLRSQQQQQQQHSNNNHSHNQQPKPIILSDPLTNRRLSALEIDPRAALSEFQNDLQRLFDMTSLSNNKFLEELGLTQELTTMLRNPPPGLDEYVALANVLDPNYNTAVNNRNNHGVVMHGDDGRKQAYDVIIVDTAPTGHTLRMLQLPQFLDGFLQTVLSLRAKLKGLANTIQLFMDGGNGDEGKSSPSSKMNVDDALSALENFQRRASQLRYRLQDSSCTKFVVVTIPTVLSVRESQRLMVELHEQGICVSDLVVNQCIGGGGDTSDIVGGDDNDAATVVVVSDAMKRYYNRRVAGQQRWISELEEACMDVSASEEYHSNSGQSEEDGSSSSSRQSSGIEVTQVPFYDMELVGVPALGYLGSQTFLGGSTAHSERQGNNFARLIQFDQRDDNRRRNSDSARIYNPKVVICGGKGGVGKTTTSASLAIAMASAGHNVALVSTDPAHSLGDALDMNLRGGSLVDVPLFGVIPPPPTMVVEEEGTLKAMEIDPTSALKEFRDSIDKLLGRNTDINTDGSTPRESSSSSDLSSTLRSLGEMIDALPAGTDEVVALAKVIQLIRGGNFDRVVLDTAPTGHTLRMLTTPSFLADLIEKVLSVSRKLNSNAAIKMLLSSAIARSANNLNLDDDVAEGAKNALLKFQVSMYDLEDMFADPTSTEFLIVTIGTELAVRESVRLLNELTFGADMPVRVRNVVVNQVLDPIDDGGGDEEKDGNEKLQGFVTRLTRSQSSSIQEIHAFVDQLDNAPRVTTVELLDVEPRGVYGLKALSEQLLVSPSSSSSKSKQISK